MCGIFGFVSKVPLADAPARRTLAAMARALAHRGPDGAAAWIGGRAALGFVRLAIVAPREPAAVFTAAEGRVASVFNGELYNHRSLRAQLRQAGVAASGESDSALIPCAFAAHGERFVEQLLGPYAIALYDGRSGTLHLYRDRLGKKPLFFARTAQGLFFASEVKALIAAGAVRVRPRADHATRFMLWGKLEDAEPLLEGVEVVAPAEHLRFRAGAVRGERTWRLEEHGAAEDRDAETLDDRLRDALTRATSDRSASEVPAALLVSGGLDSSVIARLARERIGLAYTLEMPGDDESRKAATVCRHLKLEHTLVPGGRYRRAELERALWHLEVPDDATAFGMAVAHLRLARRLSLDGIKVVLSGEGADELFLGYPWDVLQAAGEHYWPVPKYRHASGVSPAARLHLAIARARARQEGWDPRAQECWRMARHGATLALARREGLSLLKPELRSDIAGANRTLRGAGAQSAPHPARARQLDGLGCDLLSLPFRHADRLMLAHGVEARMPFLDHRLVELALTAPQARLERAGMDKPLLRELVRPLLPGLQLPPKRGFRARALPGVPMLRRWALDLARDGGLAVDGGALRRRALALDAADVPGVWVVWRAVLLETCLRGLEHSRAPGGL